MGGRAVNVILTAPPGSRHTRSPRVLAAIRRKRRKELVLLVAQRGHYFTHNRERAFPDREDERCKHEVGL